MTLDPLFDVKGRVIVVTGGAGKLGHEFADTLHERGALVALFDRTVPPCLPDGMLAFDVDVTDKQSIESATRSLIDKWGIPFGLINNAALDSPPDAPLGENGPFETYPEASWDKVMDVNVKGVFLCCQVLGACMREAGRGSIVNVASIYGMVSPDQSLYEYRRQRGETFFKPVAYSASKSALYNLTRYLAAYWGGAGVRVNTLSFGGVFVGQEKVFLDGYEGRVPMGRMARQDEYNGAVVFLMSDASSYMTGANMVLDGGWTAI
jgi:NAD(P)-dependent dehydrogenase (short-subunit alcohol dehydrogenase family)